MFTKLLRALVVVLALGFSAPGSQTVSAQHQAVNAQKKTVHVKGYTKKDGTKVKAHDRKAPAATKAAKAEKPPKAAKTAKTTPTTTATKATSGTTKPTAASAARDERGRIQRSDAARHAFMRQTGFRNGRPGYIIDHIVALACGGADAPSNMQWQTIEAAKAKDTRELAGCR